MSEEDIRAVHFNRRVSIGVIMTLIAQIIVVVWWASDFRARTEAHLAENLRRIEVLEKDCTPARLMRIETILERIEQRMGADYYPPSNP